MLERFLLYHILRHLRIRVKVIVDVVYVSFVYFVQAIRKSCDSVFNALLDILHERVSRDIKHEVSLCIGALGYIVSTESSRWYHLMCGIYAH